MTADQDKTDGPLQSSDRPSATAAGAPVIFVSYASGDARIANELVETLEGERLCCWIAPRDVPPGTLYADAIIEGINASDAFVLLLSASAVGSGHVGKELERASSKRKPILAVRMDKAPLTHNFEYFLGESQWIEVRVGGISAALGKVAGAVRRLNETPNSMGAGGVLTLGLGIRNKRRSWQPLVDDECRIGDRGRLLWGGLDPNHELPSGARGARGATEDRPRGI